MKNQHMLCLLPVLVLAHLVLQISGSFTLHPVLTGPEMAYLASKVVFQCKATGFPPPVTYELIRETNHPVATVTDHQGDQPAIFFVKVKASSEGLYLCKVRAGEDTRLSNSIKLLVVTPVVGTRVTSDPYPPVLYEGSRLMLSCDVTKGTHLSYTWYFNREKVTLSTLPFLHPAGNKLVVENVTTKHAGKYYCMVGAPLMDDQKFSSSKEVEVIVKVYFSAPMISYSISKEGSNYRGNVTCSSLRGSPPVTFHLLLDDKEVGSVTAIQSLVASFPVDILPGRDMGTAQCRVQSDVQQMMSAPLILEVVPVRGPVHVEAEYLYRADSEMAATRLHCQLKWGTFPTFTWLFNNSVLPTIQTHTHSHTPHYILTDHGRTLVLPKLSPKEAGAYSCRARDSYDNSAPWVESAAVQVHITETKMTSIEGISIWFCCFLLLTLMGSVACGIRKLNRHQARTDVNALTTPTAPPLPPVHSQPEDTHTDTNSVDNHVQSGHGEENGT